jgi:hypothetical protein
VAPRTIALNGEKLLIVSEVVEFDFLTVSRRKW